jgi:hypothetical protein
MGRSYQIWKEVALGYVNGASQKQICQDSSDIQVMCLQLLQAAL